MANAGRDGNRVTALLATSNADGVTLLPVYVDSATNRLLVNATITGAITASSASVGTTGSAVPGSADFIGINVAGNLRGATGVNPSGSVYAAQVDLASVAGTTIATGNGTNTGAIRVAIASDNTAFSVNATLSAETTKVIGTVNIAASQTIAVTNTGTFAVQATLAAETTKVIGTARIIGNAGAVVDGVNTAATAPANGILGLGIYNSTEPSPTTGQSVGIQLDSKGRQRQVIMDAAGNTRGLNIDANNNLGAVLQTQTDTVMVGGINVKEINAVAPLMGNGISGTGALRVAIASDNTVLPATGAGATAAAVPANAAYTGLIAKTALPSAGTDANLVGAMGDKYGRQVVLIGAMRDIVLPMTQLTLTSTTTETSLIAAVASTFNDLVSVVVINTSATATQVDFRDSTAGTIRLSLYVPAGDTRGIVLPTPIPQAAVNTAWTAKCGTSVASVIITGTYIANK